MKNEVKFYFTCPIQALYMMKEFGVEFIYETRDGFVKLQNVELFGAFDKIYVAKESEHIFEPKEGDYGIIKGRIGNSFSRFHQDDWVSHANIGILPSIIMRDNKQFFMAKQEIIDKIEELKTNNKIKRGAKLPPLHYCF